MTSRLPGTNFKKKLFYFFSNYLPLQIWTLRICNHDISKSITARSFKLCQLIENDEYINQRKLKKKKVNIFFSNYLPLQIWTLKICNHDISKTITARSFKLGQLIEDDE